MAVQTNRPILEWETIDWVYHEGKVRYIQEKIYQETQLRHPAKAHNWRRLLVRSLSIRLLAVRQVTQLSSGRHTPGYDGKLYRTNTEKQELAETLEFRGYQPKPVVIKYIPKPNGSRRKLGIPIIYDRAMQYIGKAAIEPIMETQFEPHSFGFRPNRNCHDAVYHLMDTLRPHKGRTDQHWWIFDMDIKACFDTIDHHALLKKVPALNREIWLWLKAGAIDEVGFQATEQGTPQGGVISPLLANIALDGMERLFGIYSRTGKYLPPSGRRGLNKDVSLFRYADDVVAIAPSKARLVDYVIPQIEAFLHTMGLELNQAKSKVVQLTEGFDFLGFHIQQFRRANGTHKMLYFGPERSRVDRFLSQIKERLKHEYMKSAKDIILWLNRRIRGWANYYKWSMASKMFAYVDYQIFRLLWEWVKRKHYRRGATWRKRMYWKTEGNKHWVFQMGSQTLISASKLTTDWKRYQKVRILANPFDSSTRDYWREHNKGFSARPSNIAGASWVTENLSEDMEISGRESR